MMVPLSAPIAVLQILKPITSLVVLVVVRFDIAEAADSHFNILD